MKLNNLLVEFEWIPDFNFVKFKLFLLAKTIFFDNFDKRFKNFVLFLNAGLSCGIILSWRLDLAFGKACHEPVKIWSLDSASSWIVRGTFGGGVTVRDANISPPYKLFIRMKQINNHPATKGAAFPILNILPSQDWLKSRTNIFKKPPITSFVMVFKFAAWKYGSNWIPASAVDRLTIRQIQVGPSNGENNEEKVVTAVGGCVTITNS